jgi:Fe-S-cluster containining protein
MVTDYTKNGKCSRCGACCTGLANVSKKEIKRITNFLNKNKDIISISNEKVRETYKTGIINTRCIYFHENKCMIYEVRPNICRTFICNNDKKLKTDKSHYLMEMWMDEETVRFVIRQIANQIKSNQIKSI